MTDWNKAIEAICRWHLDRAEECDSIAAANRYNPLGPDAQTHATDHRLNADLIRAEFIRGSIPTAGDARAETQKWRNDALEKAADIARRYESNPHCVDDILALRDTRAVPANQSLSGEAKP